MPRNAELSFTLTNTPAALKGSHGAALEVVPVVDGTTWEQVLARLKTHPKTSDIPDWANLPDVGISEVVILYPASAAAGDTMQVTMKRNLYLVMCSLPPEEGERGFPAILLQTMDS